MLKVFVTSSAWMPDFEPKALSEGPSEPIFDPKWKVLQK
jgi:hypothetical protein